MTHVGVPMVVSSVESSRKRPRSSSDISESELTARSSAIDQGPTLFIMSPTSGRYIARSKSQGCEKSNTVSGIESSKSGDPAGNSGSQVSPRRHNNSASSGPSPVPTPEPLRQVPSAPPLRSPNKLLPRRPFSTANNEVATTKPEVSSNDSDDNSESEEISYFPAKILHRSQIVSHMSSIPALVPKKSPSLPDKKRNDAHHNGVIDVDDNSGDGNSKIDEQHSTKHSSGGAPPSSEFEIPKKKKQNKIYGF